MRRWRTVDPTLDRPVHKQISDILREDITSGRLGPGQILPSEAVLAAEFGVGRNSIRTALSTLRIEGLIVSEKGRGSRVREVPEVTVVTLPEGARFRVRMPTDDERRDLEIPPGQHVPIVVVQVGDAIVKYAGGDLRVFETPPGTVNS